MGSMTLLGVGSQPTVVTGPFSFVGPIGTSSGANTISGVLNLGTAANTMVILAWSAFSNNTSAPVVSSITVGGAAATLNSGPFSNSSGHTTAIYSKFYSTGPGSVTVSLTSSGGNFVPSALQVFILTGATSSVVAGSGGFTKSGSSTPVPASPTISVTNGDYMVAAFCGFGTPTPTGMSVAPSHTNASGFDTGLISWDWAINSTNALFALNDANNDSSVAAASYH